MSKLIPYREDYFYGRSVTGNAAPKLLLHAPHCAVRKHHIHDLMALLEVPESRWPAYFEFFCYVNGDQGSEEYTRRVAEILTSIDELDRLVAEGLLPQRFHHQGRDIVDNMSIVALFANCHRSILDLNRTFAYHPTDARSQLTPPMPEFIHRLSPPAVEIAHDIHQRAMAVEERLYAQVCRKEGYGVLNAHTYMPINPVIQSFDTLYSEIYSIFGCPDTYQDHFQNNRRPDVQFIAADGNGEQLSSPSTIGFMVDKFQRTGIHKIGVNMPYYHVDSATSTRRSRQYPGRITVLEIARDLFLDCRDHYREQLIEQGELTIAVEPTTRLASAVAAGLLMSILVPSE